MVEQLITFQYYNQSEKNIVMAKKLKIIYLIPYFAPAWEYGGPVRVVYELSKHLIKKGHQVTVCTTDAYEAQKRLSIKTNQPELFEDIKVFRFKNLSNYLAWNARLFWAPKMKNFLKTNLKNYDLIHAHDFFVPINNYAIDLAQKQNIPVIMSAHGSLDKERLKQKELTKKIFNSLIGKNIIKKSACLHALTNQEKEDYLNQGAQKSQIRIIPNGIDLKEFERPILTQYFKKKYGIQEEEKVILYLGRIYNIKGVDLLVESFGQLIKDNPQLKIKLLLVGPDVDNYTILLKQIAQKLNIDKKIIFTGPLFGKEKIKAYKSADLFVFPSQGEGLSISLLEACASGLPVVISSECNLPEVEEYKAGRIVSRDKDKIAQAMFEILINQNLSQNMSFNAQKMVSELFSWKKVVFNLEKLYYELVKNNPANN
jgi:glycosyltransferase involved in cell wall biosynthesis